MLGKTVCIQCDYMWVFFKSVFPLLLILLPGFVGLTGTGQKAGLSPPTWSPRVCPPPNSFQRVANWGCQTVPLALHLDPRLTLHSLVNHISDYMLIKPGFPFVPTAALPLAAVMNAIIAA